MKDGLPLLCPDCDRPVLDTGEGYLVDESGYVHECEESRKAKTPDEIPDRCQFTIQRPAPVRTYAPDDGRQKYPWGQMQPGDMFLVPCAPEEASRVQARLSQAGRNWFALNAPALKAATTVVNGGVRVWAFLRPGVTEDGEAA